MKKIVIEVVKKNGGDGCEAFYSVGQKWEMNGETIPGGICVGAMSALLPWITCIKFDAQMPWTQKGKINVCCTDPDHPVVFEIREVQD